MYFCSNLKLIMCLICVCKSKVDLQTYNISEKIWCKIIVRNKCKESLFLFYYCELYFAKLMAISIKLNWVNIIFNFKNNKLYKEINWFKTFENRRDAVGGAYWIFWKQHNRPQAQQVIHVLSLASANRQPVHWIWQ